ncbi:MAG: indole-3-glycerol phosphate synthase TrpC [Dysgonomonas mossii]|uniref:indole-3-glycerol phosphate synthase TrpC n=1 Tax=Dysgonomonas mossii TaxID=163665 RepID=UPI001D2AB663|nr:indole-3-glycerol phosphate synthase TrpC [Dysgonomonas mossii]MBS5796194.1 indole-3-glycerol phosphate synthase TrpC [Dysgonomonas mossii]MBS7110886.1 indole-3-glycerol phosphate synthase TrpC [Dysgonomonas mossii]
MTNILDKIIANKRLEVERHKKETSINELEKRLSTITTPASFKEAIKNSRTGIIAEFKRRSPSRDWIFKDAKIEDVIPLYSQNGAGAISVLTDMDFFGGELADLELAGSLTKTPLLRKDFVVDEYQLYQAKISGASAILLIASALTIDETKQLAKKAKELNLDVLLEIHNEQELHHINDKVDVVGVNNRNLGTFVTDIQISFDLADKIPNDFIKISESGISQPQTVIDLQQAGYKGFLMGENFMKTSNPGKALEDFINQLI